MTTTAKPSFREAIAVYRDKRLALIFALGISSGFPWILIGSAMSAWLKEAGLTRTAIGFFGSVFTVYAINFLWAPLVDRVKIPFLTRTLGQRRSWILAAQTVILISCISISFTNPSANLLWTSLLALLIAIASATQDIAIDAYRIEVIPADQPEKIPAGAAMATAGWWTGYQLLGAPTFFLAGAGIPWAQVYWFLAAMLALLMLMVIFAREPTDSRSQKTSLAEQRYQQWLTQGAHRGSDLMSRIGSWLLVTLFEPIAEFFRRNGWQLAIGILSFVFLFKIGEAFLGRMSIVFYKEVGFTDTQIGTYSKLIGWYVTIFFSFVGSLLNARFGIVRGLFIGGIAMAATNLLFSWLAVIGPNTTVFALAVVLDGFTAAFSTVTFVAFISYLTSRSFTATQYALLASIGNFGRTSIASASGLTVDYMRGDWAGFFVLTALMVIPSLLILLWIGKHFDNATKRQS